MATNICSRTRTKYSTVKELAEELGCCVQQVYKTMKRPEMESCKRLCKANRDRRSRSKKTIAKRRT